MPKGMEHRRPRHRPALLIGLTTVATLSSALAGSLAAHAATSASATPPEHRFHAALVATTAPTTTAPAPPTTTTTAPPPPPPVPPTTAPPPPPASAPASAPGYGCGPALGYLQSHEAPGFTASCPGPNDGHQATTTAYYSNGQVTGTIGIEVPCPAAYMNEAHNSWVLRYRYLGTPIPDGLGDVIDPYGYCH